MENLSFLIDLKTLEMFSDEKGWNRTEISLKNSQEWTKTIYQKTGIFSNDIEKKSWSDRRLRYIKIPMPFEPEILT